MSSLRPTPGPSSPALDRHGVLQFRHPWVADPHGYGQVVRRSFAKLNPAERGLLLMSAQNLVGNAPLRRRDAPAGLDPRLLDAYFKPLETLQQQQEFLVQVHADGTLHVQGVPSTQDALINDPVQAGKYAARIKQLEDQHASVLEETQRLRRQVEEYERIIARKERELNEHVTVTLEQAFAAFQEDYRPNAPRTKYNVAATVGKFVFGKTLRDGRRVQGLGPKKLLVDVTPAEIDRWLDHYPTQDRVTLIHLKAHLSIFWSTCRRLYDLSATPFREGKLKTRGDLLTIARKRCPPAIQKLADLRMLLEALEPDPYWQSWVAFACLAGPRWNEQANLPASALDLAAEPPRVIFEADDEHGMKTRGNAVPIERKVLLPALQRFRATWEEGRRLAWPSLRPHRRRANARAQAGAWAHTPFTRALDEALAAARRRSAQGDHAVWGYGPAEYRHTFGTLLALAGYNATEIARMMRNSAEVASAHYIAYHPTDERIRGALEW